MAEQIHIGFGIDKNFGRFAGITITSLVHNNIANELIIHIVYDELLPEDIDRLKKTEQLYRNLTLHFYQITSTEGMTFIVPLGAYLPGGRPSGPHRLHVALRPGV